MIPDDGGPVSLLYVPAPGGAVGYDRLKMSCASLLGNRKKSPPFLPPTSAADLCRYTPLYVDFL
jgi:hypothetical protein